MQRNQMVIGLLVALILIAAGTTAHAQNPMALSPDGKTFVTGDGKTVGVFDAQTQKALIRIEAHQDTVTSVAYSPDGRFLASGGKDKSACVFEAATGKQLLRFKTPNAVTTVAFSADGKVVIVREADLTLREFEVATGKEIRVSKEKEKKEKK